MSRYIDVIVVGGVTKDQNVNLVTRSKWFSYGGGALYVAYILSKLGIRVGLVTYLSPSDLQELKNIGILDINIALDGVKQIENSTLSFTNQYTGSERIQYAKAPSYKITIGDIPDLFLDAQFAIITPVIGEVDKSVIEHIRRRGLITVVELQGFVRIIEDDQRVFLTKSTLPYKDIDILKGSIEEFQVLIDNINYHSLLNLSKRGPWIIAVTMGNKGAFILHNDVENKIYRYYPPKVNAVDETGAGDVFLAGLLYGLYCEYDIQYAGRIATGLATYSTKFRGLEIPINRDLIYELAKEVDWKVISI